MADAPGIKDALQRVKGDIRRQQDVIDNLQAQLDAAKSTIVSLRAIRDDYQAYIDLKAAQP